MTRIWTRPPLLAATAAAALVAAPLPAAALVADAPEEWTIAKDEEPGEAAALDLAKAKLQQQMDEAIAFLEKLFDMSKLPPVEPARLALAETTTAALIPPGSLEKMVDRLYGPIIDMAMAEMDKPSAATLSAKTGIESEQIAELDEATQAQIAQMFDPRRKEREEKILAVLRPLLSEALSDMEAPMRAGLARAYAREYSAAQLEDINAFFATPTGRSFAGETMVLQSDPELILAMVRGLPPMLNKFIDRAPTLEAEFKDIPTPRTLADLDKAEMKRLAKLLKVDVKRLTTYRDTLDAPLGEDGEAMLDAYDRANWSEADLAEVEALEQAAYEAEQKAIANALKSKGAPTDSAEETTE
ncbi:DUF2059 domain-containing protein [Sphingopyxis sp. MWB1]|uniref:DUF2059 domain-containing protein n=1 Tax=Sphingopyxis sp. MWB1 TaxID=1537715 RepID=UPI00051A126A|nr:DUF2059 domain-containing protein [Sphingopyxis sp. MWB1]